MKLIRWFICTVLCLAGLVIAAGTVWLSLEYKDALPMLLEPAEEAQERVETLMDAVCAGEYELAGSLILGNPQLGVDRDAADAAGVLIWNAFADSLAYEMVGECYTTETGVAQKVTFSCLDVRSVTKNLKVRAQTLLEERVRDAEDVSEVYDENNEYREDFVMEVLFDAVEDALQQDSQQMHTEFTVNMVYQDGDWWIISDNALMAAISGGIVG